MAYIETNEPAKPYKGYNNKALTQGIQAFGLVNPNPVCPYKDEELKREFFALSKDQLKAVMAEGNRAKWELVRRMLADDKKDTKNFLNGVGFIILIGAVGFMLHLLGVI